MSLPAQPLGRLRPRWFLLTGAIIALGILMAACGQNGTSGGPSAIAPTATIDVFGASTGFRPPSAGQRPPSAGQGRQIPDTPGPRRVMLLPTPPPIPTATPTPTPTPTPPPIPTTTPTPTVIPPPPQPQSPPPPPIPSWGVASGFTIPVPITMSWGEIKISRQNDSSHPYEQLPSSEWLISGDCSWIRAHWKDPIDAGQNPSPTVSRRAVGGHFPNRHLIHDGRDSVGLWIKFAAVVCVSV